MRKEWMYSLTGSMIWTGETYETREKAIEAAMNEINTEWNANGIKFIEKFEVGRKVVIPIPQIDVDQLLEDIDENYHEEVSGEFDGEEYIFEDISREQARELEDKINDIFSEWCIKNKVDPGYFSITETEVIEVK